MNWLAVIFLCAVGGAIVSVVGFCGDLFSWQKTRRAAHEKQLAELPTLRAYVDPWPDFVVLLTRIFLGVLAGVIFKAQVTTPLAAFAIGASAPALLTQFGNGRAAKPAEDGTGLASVASIRLVEEPKSEEG